MELLTVFILVFISVGFFSYRFSAKRILGEVHLPDEIKGEVEAKKFDFRGILDIPGNFVEQVIKKGNIPLESVRRKLISAGKPINTTQFFAFKILTLGAALALAFVFIQPQQPMMYILPIVIGFFIPDFWLKGKVNKRQAAILKDLPHIIDLLNICVGAGLDFMVAVSRVSQEFRPCALVQELKVLLNEIQMGSSRREALKNLGGRINSLDVTSFVRTLLQADRMGTPIADALKMQAEELRIRRFQRGEEMGLKAPIKLLFPLLFFILPVVMIIVAGPILIQFTRGGFAKF